MKSIVTLSQFARTLKPLLMLLPALALLFGTGCDKDPVAEVPEDPQTPDPTTITLSTYDIVLSRGNTAVVDVKVTGITADGSALALETESGDAPQYVYISTYYNVSKDLVRLTLRDKRTADTGQKYNDAVYVVHTPSGCKSDQPIQMHSTPYMPVVYVTTEVAQGSITKDTWVKGTIEIDGGGDLPDLEKMVTEVKGRGNSTWGWEKKPYALKLDSKQEVLGMPKHKRWCLIANYMDRTHLRNRVAYYISENTDLAYTTRNKYAELYFNGAYYGLFLLTEQIKEDKNRVNITELGSSDNSGEAVTGGYLLEFDTNFDEDKRFRSIYSQIPVNLKYPDAEDITAEQWNYIQSYVNEVDKAVYALSNGSGSPAAVWELLDRNSMIDFWIVFEIMANHEILHPKSIYFHKDRGGKLVAGPVWDFDYETLVQHTQTRWINYNLSYAYNEFNWYERNWWNILLKYDASFRADVKARWNELYPFLQTVPAFMESERKSIAEAEKRNRQRWPSINTGGPNRDESLSFDDAVDRLKEVYNTRLQWMNSQIANW